MSLQLSLLASCMFSVLLLLGGQSVKSCSCSCSFSSTSRELRFRGLLGDVILFVS